MILISSPSWAVVVEPGQGDLSINQGHGFRPAKGPTKANVGDSVMVGPSGAATVVYDDGCKVNVQPGAVTTIAALSPCASGSKADDSQGSRWFDWVFGGMVVGAFVYAGTQDHDHKGASP